MPLLGALGKGQISLPIFCKAVRAHLGEGVLMRAVQRITRAKRPSDPEPSDAALMDLAEVSALRKRERDPAAQERAQRPSIRRATSQSDEDTRRDSSDDSDDSDFNDE